MRSRWYDPEAGRFVSEDPSGFAGGPNLYTFAGNDPINGRDPAGLSDLDCVWIPGHSETVKGGVVVWAGYWKCTAPDPRTFHGGNPPGTTGQPTSGGTPPFPGPWSSKRPVSAKRRPQDECGNAMGDAIWFGFLTGATSGAKTGFQQGVSIANRRALIWPAVVVGAAGAIGTFEDNGVGGPIGYFTVRAIEYGAVVGAMTVTEAVIGGLGGAILGGAAAQISCVRTLNEMWTTSGLRNGVRTTQVCIAVCTGSWRANGSWYTRLRLIQTAPQP